MPVSSSTPPPQLSSQPSSADADKSRAPPTWSSITAGSNTTPMEPTPNLLAPNEFPRLATTPDRKSQPESPVNPTFRPANLATWKEGGGSRVQPTVNDVPPMIPNHPGANFYQQPMPNVRMYPPQMVNATRVLIALVLISFSVGLQSVSADASSNASVATHEQPE